MKAPWHSPVGILPESRLLASVAEFTHHRDIDALDHSMVLSLAELIAVNNVTLCRRGDSPRHPVDSIVVCSRKPDGGFVIEALDPTLDGDPIDTLVCAMATLEAISDITDDGSSRLVIPIQREHTAIGALMLEAPDSLDDVRSMVEGFARIYCNYIALLNESERDKLTGLYNRRSFEQRLRRLLTLQRHASRDVAPDAEEKRRPVGENSQLYLAILDIDHFKRINDTYGHVYGDEVILMLAQHMRASFRQGDVLFRFGGEEFVILLAAQDEAEVHLVLDRFRRFVVDHAFPQVGHVSVSIGYARITEHDYPEIVLDRADKALYFAKQNGRNSVHGYESLTRRGELAAPVSLGSIDLF
ncbi:diguanylate cyclase (GGDEF)-like protein [Luteibacter sp. W1I16]|uniref:GGDEF domain-containing protein n=1 Tax=Luteibacter sp. W1I16 TaxID=3373922 RepID=UPI003D19C13B